jgi:hypothetical protein
MSNVEQDLRELLAAKAHELFAAYGVPCKTSESVRPEDIQLCGVLGFSGEHLCGTVVIGASAEALAASNPVAPEPSRSWSAELANQLVGRFRNALLRRGVDVSVSVPVVLRAQLVPGAERIAPIHLVVGLGSAMIWLELEDQSAQLAGAMAEGSISGSVSCLPAVEMLAEGDMLLF